MAEPEHRPDRVASPETGRHSHRRRAHSRRTGEHRRLFSFSGLESRVARWITTLIGIAIVLGQLAFPWLFAPDQLMRGVIIIAGVIALSAVITWIDQVRSKKRDPKPRWMRGVLVAGFLSISVVVGALVVLTLSAGPIEDGSFEGASLDGDRGSPLENKTMQLKLLAFHIIATVAGLALLINAGGPEKHRRSNSGRFKAVSAVPPA